MNRDGALDLTFDEYLDFYSFKDSKEVYTNGSELIPVFRVKQWIEAQPTILYLCDRKACKNCSDECKHTAKIEHAVNFKKIDDLYVQVEKSNFEQETLGIDSWDECGGCTGIDWGDCDGCNVMKAREKAALEQMDCPSK